MKSFAEAVAPRLEAANKALMEKGWPCPSIEVGVKVLGKHGMTCWANGYLTGGDNPMRLPWMHDASMEQLLDAIDKAVVEAPVYAHVENTTVTALAKLTDQEKDALGLKHFEMERRLAR